MKTIAKVAVLAGVLALAGCTGSVYNSSKDCSYDYLLHPAVSISSIIGGCGPAAK